MTGMHPNSRGRYRQKARSKELQKAHFRVVSPRDAVADVLFA
jgi:hypothetical protein